MYYRCKEMDKKYLIKERLKSIGCRFNSIGSNGDIEKVGEYEGDYFYSTEYNRYKLRIRDSEWYLFKGLLYDTLVDSDTFFFDVKNFLPLILKHDK